MHAYAVNKYGLEDRLQRIHTDIPVPKSNEVRIEVKAVSVNDFDLGMIKGKPYILRLGGLTRPRFTILGCDVAGIVESVGSEVTQWQVGDRVVVDLSNQKWGGYGEFTTAKADSLSRICDELSFEEAAALPHSGVLALQSIRQIGGFVEGKHLLVNGAGGGAGSIIIKLAKRAGMEVTAVDHTSKQDFLLQQGADHFIDYTLENWYARKNSFDRVIDLKGHGRPLCFYQSLTEGGKLSLVGGKSSTILGMITVGLALNLFGSKKLKVLGHKPNPDDVNMLMKLCDEGVISPIIDSVYPIEEIQAAVKHYREGKMKGKVIVNW